MMSAARHCVLLLTARADRSGRRRPFASWMKRLAQLKGTSNSDGPGKRHSGSAHKSKKQPISNNPYPASGNIETHDGSSTNGHLSFSTPPTAPRASYSSAATSQGSVPISTDGVQPGTTSNKSVAPTVSTNVDTVHSEMAHSKARSTNTGAALSGGGAGSTFSSRTPSERSLTTTLTTIQSTAPSALLPGVLTSNAPINTGSNGPHIAQDQHNVQFSHQYPVSPPPSAIPSHMTAHSQSAGPGHPSTYTTATANNLLTDDASILTLASSSKRRRRRSFDTDASVRALAPSSLWGGSRESLPLSVLSANPGDQGVVGAPPTSSGIHHSRPGVSGLASTERASIYSASGIVPALTSERNSYYAAKQHAGDGSSVRSGLLGHGRNDSMTGSITGAVLSTLR